MTAATAIQQIHVDDATARAVGALRSLRSVAEIVAEAPDIIAGLGFDRVILSDVTDDVWTPVQVHVPRDAAWAGDILEVGRSNPQELGPALIEAEMKRTRRPYIVREVQDNPRVNRPIALASKSQDYLAAPVVVGDEVGAFIHVDRYWGRAPFSAYEAAQLAVFAEAMGLAVERAQLVEKLARVAADLGAFADGAAGFGPVPAASAPQRRPVVDLTPRERDVADLVAEGRSNAQIAADLFLSEATVKTHVKHILRKLGAAHRAEAVAKLLRGDAG